MAIVCKRQALGKQESRPADINRVGGNPGPGGQIRVRCGSGSWQARPAGLTPL